MGNPAAPFHGRADRAAALIGFGETMAGSFFHSFTRTAATERATIRLAFEQGHATLDGWIPTRLDVEGTVRAEDVDTLRGMFGDGLRSTTTGGRGRVTVRAHAERPDRQEEYRRAIRAGMSNLVAATTRNESLEVTAEDGLRSLEVALRATDDRPV